MDLSTFSTEDLQALKGGDLTKVSTAGLQALRHAQTADQIANDPISQGARDVTGGMGFFDKFNAGVGKAMTDIGRGVGQRLGMVSRGDVAESRRLDAPLMKTGAGVAGNVMGNLTLLAPAAAVPGVSSVPAAAALSGALGYLQPSASLKEDALNTLSSALGGAFGQFGANKLGVNAATQEAQNAASTARNAQKTATARNASEAGYVIPPEDLGQGGGLVTRLLSGVGGKIKTAQVASERNQPVTNDLTRRALGLAPTDALDVQTLNNVRKQAASAYEQVRGAGTVTADKPFTQALDDIAAKYKTALPSFPGIGKTDMHGNPVDEVGNIVNALKASPKFDSSEAVDALGVLRENADKAFNAGDKTLGKATRAAADALEGVLERHLQAAGNPDALKAFQDARTLIAKTYSVQKGLNATTGDVSAGALAKQLEKGKPLSGDLLTVAQTAQAYPKATQSLKESPKQISPLDVAFALSHAAGGKIANMLTLGARPAARSVLLSQPMQQSALNAAETPAPANLLTRLLANENVMLPAGVASGNALSRYLVNQ